MREIEEYFDAWSGIYDAELRGNGGADVEFYRKLAQDVGGSVLEIGCGTGRIYLKLLEDGADAYGIDISAGMLDELREKARERGLRPAVRKADMADFSFDREFELVLLPAANFLYNTELDDQLSTLLNVDEVLAEDGTLALSYYRPAVEAMCDWYGTEHTSRIELDGMTYRMCSTVSFADKIERIIRIDKTVKDQNGQIVADAEAIAKLIPKREMELLLRFSEFTDYKVYGGFNHEKLSEESDHFVWIAKRSSSPPC